MTVKMAAMTVKAAAMTVNAAVRSVKARPPALLQSRQILRQRVDIRRAQRLCRRSHVAVHVEARAGLEAAQLGLEVLGLLPREARDVLLAFECGAVARDAVELLGDLLAPIGGFLRGLGRRSRMLLRREELA